MPKKSAAAAGRKPVAVAEADPGRGLTEEEVRLRGEAGLRNTAVEANSKTVGGIILSNVFTYFNLLFLLLAACVAAVHSWNDLVFLLGEVIMLAGGEAELAFGLGDLEAGDPKAKGFQNVGLDLVVCGLCLGSGQVSVLDSLLTPGLIQFLNIHEKPPVNIDIEILLSDDTHSRDNFYTLLFYHKTAKNTSCNQLLFRRL